MGSLAAADLRFQPGIALSITAVLGVSAPIIQWVPGTGDGIHPYALASLIMAPLLALAALVSRRQGGARIAYGLSLAAGLAATIAIAVVHPEPVPGGLLRPAAVMPLLVTAVVVPLPGPIALLGLTSIVTTILTTTGGDPASVLSQVIAQTAASGLAVAISYGWSRARRNAEEAHRLEAEVHRGDIERDAIARFVRHAAHELRTPLTPIRLVPAVLRNQNADPATREKALGQLERQVDRLATIVDRLGTLASMESEPTPFPGDLAEQARRVAAAFPGTEVDAPVTAPTQTSDVGVHAMLSELVTNAHEAGAQRIRIQVKQDGGDWTVTVDDNGPGVPDEVHGSLKQPFGRVQLDDHPHARAGLGLGLVDAMAAAAGGHFQLGRSELGGLRATVTLPVARPPGGRVEDARRGLWKRFRD